MKEYKIYALINGRDIVYVGCTYSDKCITRIYGHKTTSKKFDDYKVLETTRCKETAKELESFYIWLYDTFNNGLNKTANGRGDPMGIREKGQEAIKRKIRIYNDNFDKTYNSVSEGCRELNIDNSNIIKVAKGNIQQHKGYKAEYIV